MSAVQPILCAGHFGDLCIILPLLKSRFDKSGVRQPVIVGKKYSAMLEGVSYVEPVVFDGDWKRGGDSEVNRAAAEFAKSKFPDSEIAFVNPVFGKNGEAKHTDSFAKELWHHAGTLEGWSKLPLVFDRRDPEREAELARKLVFAKPTILAALDGISSPFMKKPELLKSLRDRFKHWKVVDMASVKAKKPFDLLGLFDRAALLVTIDTMHLQLSRASAVPVVALARDVPSKWNGSPWHSRYAFYCRYGEYDWRADELLQAAEDTLTGLPKPWTKPVNGLMENGYNPAIVRWDGKLLFAYRYHPDRAWRTKLRLATLNDNFELIEDREIQMPADIANYSHEDPRFFVHKDRLFMSYTVAIPGDVPRQSRCVMAYGELACEAGTWQIKNHTQPHCGNNDWSGKEKNWVFWGHDGRLFCIYQCDPEQIVLELDGAKVVGEHRSGGPKWAFGEIRGGTAPMLFNGRWIRFFHSSLRGRYYIGACEMEMTPPFKTIKVSSHPIIAGHEWLCGAPHWKPNVAIPYGAIVDGDKIVLSLGINDCRACVSVLDEKQLRL